VDAPGSTAAELDALTVPDELAWKEERKRFLLY